MVSQFYSEVILILYLFVLITSMMMKVKEIGERRESIPFKASEQLADKKKGFVDWVSLIKPQDEEKDHWVSPFAC